MIAAASVASSGRIFGPVGVFSVRDNAQRMQAGAASSIIVY